MKKLAAVLLVIGFTSATALGGVVEFAPDKNTTLQGESGSFLLTIAADSQWRSRSALPSLLRAAARWNRLRYGLRAV